MPNLEQVIKDKIYINEKGLKALTKEFPALLFLQEDFAYGNKELYLEFLHEDFHSLDTSQIENKFDFVDNVEETFELLNDEISVFVKEYCDNTEYSELSIVGMSLVKVLENPIKAKKKLLVAFCEHTIEKALDFTFETEHLVVEESQNTLIKYGLQEIETKVSWKHFSFQGAANAISRHILIRLSGDDEYEYLKKNTRSDFLRLGNAIVTFSYIDNKPSLVGLTESFVEKYLA
ncbi:hypothetical protein LS74_001325 [Helicobacter magdeburgensis]|uniref:Uncharacterized protein n=1 Tax=Helicobacter magdeburgensis TaxID=471858 RepID=A0A4U8T1W3_9HELI|nr:hypothetical protein [Helicobacter magdeburgensis]TLD93401.1 hypothetical protein LS74_001325 [Helicobacter magdeburgensis]